MINTERLTIRRFKAEDSVQFSDLIKDKMSSEFSEYDDQYPTDPESLHAILSYFISTDEFYAVIYKPENKLVGYVSLNRTDSTARNLGYCIISSFRGKGIGTEAAGAVIDYARNTLKLKKLISATAECNTPSVRILQNSGFKETGKSECSFTSGKDGRPLVFTGISFELIF